MLIRVGYHRVPRYSRRRIASPREDLRAPMAARMLFQKAILTIWGYNVDEDRRLEMLSACMTDRVQAAVPSYCAGGLKINSQYANVQ